MSAASRSARFTVGTVIRVGWDVQTPIGEQ